MRQSETLYNDTIRIYTRESKGIWQAGYRLNKQHIRESLRTKSRKKAKERAIKRYHELEYKVNQGLALKGTLFHVLCDKYSLFLVSQQQKGEVTLHYLKDQTLIIKNYLRPYFGDTLVEHINDVRLSKYNKWRETQGRKHPSSSTKNLERTCLRKLMQFAVNEGMVEAQALPNIRNVKRSKNRRPHFNIQEYKWLLKRSCRRIRKAPNKVCKERRIELHYWICMLANTGMRPVEAKNLRWCDVDDIGESVVLSVNGKDKFGDLVARPPAKHYLAKIKALRNNPKPTDYVWNHVSFKKALHNLLLDAGLLVDADEKRRCAYSFRHSYATNMLVYKNTNVYTLARNMRTSVAMIERHYSHLIPRLAKDELTK